MPPALFKTLDILADAVNPGLCLALLLIPLVRCRRAAGPLPWRFWARCLLAVALMYLVAFVDRRLGLWRAMELDFSNHSALALVAAVSLLIFERRAGLWLAPVLLLYAVLMLVLGFHTAADMLTTAFVVVPLAVLCHVVAHREEKTGLSP